VVNVAGSGEHVAMQTGHVSGGVFIAGSDAGEDSHF
jgi:hypothetical protein